MSQAPRLHSWEFEPGPFDPVAGNVDVHLTLDDGQRRWCLFATPANLSGLLTQPAAEPAFQSAHLVVVARLSPEAVESALRYLEAEDRLLEASFPF